MKNPRQKQKKKSHGKKLPKLTPELVAECLRFGINRFVRASSTLQVLCDQLGVADPRYAVLRKVRETMDDQFAIALRETVMVRHLAKTTDSVELLFDAVGDALSGADDLPELLRLSERFAEPSDLDSSSPDTFYFHFAEMIVGLVKHLEKLCTLHPERFRLLARELPYWPMLVFKHKAANNHLFEKSADGERPLAEALELGRDCPINVSNRANYSLKTPINEFLWEVLAEFHRVRWWMKPLENGKGRRTSDERWIKEIAEKTGITPDEVKIHLEACDLPPLDKETSSCWTDKAIMPWIRLRYPDLRILPAFRGTDTGPHGKRYAPARKAVLRGLHNLARERGAGWA